MIQLKQFTLFALCTTLLTQSGCTALGLNRDLDYRKATSEKPLQYPSSISPQIKDAYLIPELNEQSKLNAIKVTNKKNTGFEAPKPIPIANVVWEQTPIVSVGRPSKPTLNADGNGYPLLVIEGDSNLVWEAMINSARQAKIKLTDRNQSLGTLSLIYNNNAVELRQTKTPSRVLIMALDHRGNLLNKEDGIALMQLLIQNWS